MKSADSLSIRCFSKAAALHARPELGVDCAAPRNETEQTIAGIWQELLGIEPIGVHDNFFELGGQSLLATQVVARVRAALQTDLPLRRFFEGPTVAELALAAAPDAKGEVAQLASSLNSRLRALQFKHLKHPRHMNTQRRKNGEPWIGGKDNGRRLGTGKPGALPRDKATIARINRWYDTRMFDSNTGDNGDFSNYGYWERHTRTSREACENLMKKLLAFIPRKQGKILDVACGKGATTGYLLSHYRPEDVTGINVSEKQLERCRVNAPNCKFLLMSATELAFDDESFDSIICVEAVFHFVTREKFLREAWRVLKPGGCLVLTDVLERKWASAPNALRVRENHVRDLEHYREIYRSAGFGDMEIVDATLPSWIHFYRRAMRSAINRLRRGGIDGASSGEEIARLRRKRRYIRSYLLVSARKGSVES